MIGVQVVHAEDIVQFKKCFWCFTIKYKSNMLLASYTEVYCGTQLGYTLLV